MCVLQGEAPAFWRGTLPLRSVSVWSNGVKGGAPSPATRSVNAPLAERAALTVMLAPQVQSHAADARFLFGPPNTDLEYPQEFRAAYDPLYEFESPSGNGINAFAGDPQVLTENRKELLVSCVNPLVLARNTLLSQISELAMRHGELRAMTQLLYLNPVLSQSDGATPQPPVEVTALGQDVAQRHFQIPFASSAWLDPASNTSQAYSRLLASELRFCYHMYSGYYLYNQALDRFVLPGFDQSNAGFEPREQGEVYWFSKSLRSTLFQSGEPWDQECPWKGSASGCRQAYSRDLNIAELAAITGSEQICPYHPGAAADWSCRKPAPDADLRGDLLSALCYLIGPQAESAVCDKLGSKRVALRSPGALRESDRSPLTQQAQNARSAILLLTHQALSSPDRSAIHDLLAEGHFDSRPITVIYMPAFGASGIGDAAANGQYLLKVREDFKQAFDIREDSDAHSANQKRRDNALIVLSPYLDPAYCKLQDSSQCYAAYWKHLLLDPDGAASLGREIFQNRILELQSFDF